MDEDELMDDEELMQIEADSEAEAGGLSYVGKGKCTSGGSKKGDQLDAKGKTVGYSWTWLSGRTVTKFWCKYECKKRSKCKSMDYNGPLSVCYFYGT